MSSTAVVDHAALMARDLVHRECRGSGDKDNAMRRVEAKWGVPYADLWKLHYRKPKDIFVGAYLRLLNAAELQRETQIKRLEHERQITQVTGRIASALVAAADALGGAESRSGE